MNLTTEKIFIFLGIANILLFSVFSFLVYGVMVENKRIREYFDSISEQTSYNFNLLSEQRATFSEEIAVMGVRLDKETEKVSIIEESLDPKNIRWAKIKKVRDAVQNTVKEFRYRHTLGTIDLTAYASAVVDWSEQYDVPVPLILGLTRRESAFRKSVKSSAGAIGLLQVMPQTATEIAGDLSVRHYSLYKIRDNVRFGIYYLMKMLDEFEGDVELALRAYNCGPTCVRKVVSNEYRDFPFETNEYIKAILGNDSDRQEGAATGSFVRYYENLGL